ncbi:MAG TPA: hypothetical protein VFZ27_05280 [Terriglobia bacterium]|nr:hypothetical protein [Terriglobia bacterium]
MARSKLFALLVDREKYSFMDLISLLSELSVEALRAQNCAEVAHLLDHTHPELIFTGTEVSDGSWRDIVELVELTSVPTNVVVVGKYQDTDLYRTTMENGAFDFILPPFEREPLAQLVSAAADDVRSQRARLSVSAVA